MENTRLITEQREALEQQTATAEVLQVINASPGNLAPVFDAMLEKAMRLCGAAFGILCTYDGERFQRRRDARRIREPTPNFCAIRGRSTDPDSALGRIVRRRATSFTSPDVMDDDAYRAGDPVARALVELGGARTALWVPLRKDDALARRHSSSTARRCGRSPTSRSRCCRTSPPRR